MWPWPQMNSSHTQNELAKIKSQLHQKTTPAASASSSSVIGGLGLSAFVAPLPQGQQDAIDSILTPSTATAMIDQMEATTPSEDPDTDSARSWSSKRSSAWPDSASSPDASLAQKSARHHYFLSQSKARPSGLLGTLK